MSDLVCDLKVPGMVLAVMAIVWMAGGPSGASDDGYVPTAKHEAVASLPHDSPLNSAQASLRLDE